MNTLFHAAFCSAHLFGQNVLVNFAVFRDILSLMDFQLFGRFDQLNALAGLPNEPRNVTCATGHLPGPLGPATAQQRPKFRNWRIFGPTETL